MVVNNWERETLLRKQIERLSEEFRGIFGLETIARYVHESLESLEGSRVQDFIPIFVDRFARERLQALASQKAES